MQDPPAIFATALTQDNIAEWYDVVFAPWVKALGLTDFMVDGDSVSARLPFADHLAFVAGAVCGQALMSAIDTVASLAIATGGRISKGTAYQHTQFLRPARGDDFRVAASVKRFGKSSAYVECAVTYETSGELVAHAVLEFAF